MGNWHISVRGVGMHHNSGNPADADVLARALVAALKAAGHQVLGAAFTYGAEENLEHHAAAVPLGADEG